MKIYPLIASAAILTFAVSLACNNPKVQTQQESKTTNKDSLVKRGEYLVNIMSCDDCHSPKIFGPYGPEPDPARRFSGHPADEPIGAVNLDAQKAGWILFSSNTTAAAGPWGVSFAANLTSDETGLGNWTEARFFKAIKEGKSKGLDNNRMLLPPMPWPNISKASDDDLKAIFAYLKSTKPVKNIVPAPIPPLQIAAK